VTLQATDGTYDVTFLQRRVHLVDLRSQPVVCSSAKYNHRTLAGSLRQRRTQQRRLLLQFTAAIIQTISAEQTDRRISTDWRRSLWPPMRSIAHSTCYLPVLISSIFYTVPTACVQTTRGLHRRRGDLLNPQSSCID